jgi:hypothetical protein
MILVNNKMEKMLVPFGTGIFFTGKKPPFVEKIFLFIE